MERMTPGFIVSAPRSGSTWLMRALSAHPEVHATEHRLFGPHHDEILDDGADRPRLRITLDRYADAHARHLNLNNTGLDIPGARERLLRDLADALFAFDRTVTKKPQVIDKVTPYPGTAANVMTRIRNLYPDAPVIGLIRDGRDVVTSGAYHWLNKHKADSPRTHGPTSDRFLTDAIVEEWAALWCECSKAAAETQHVVRYERMLDCQAAELARIFDVLALSTNKVTLDACVAAGSFERASNGRSRGTHNPSADARRGVSGDWRQTFTRRDGEIFDTIAGETLEGARVCGSGVVARSAGPAQADGVSFATPSSSDIMPSMPSIRPPNVARSRTLAAIRWEHAFRQSES